MNYREFVDGTKGAVEAAVAGMRGARALTPALHLDTEQLGVQIFGLESEFFDEGAAYEQLLTRVRPLLQAYGARQAAWSFFAEIIDVDVTEQGVEPTGKAEGAVVVAVDRERTECWIAPVYRYTNQPPALGVWNAAEPNQQIGVLVEIQEDMR